MSEQVPLTGVYFGFERGLALIHFLHWQLGTSTSTCSAWLRDGDDEDAKIGIGTEVSEVVFV